MYSMINIELYAEMYFLNITMLHGHCPNFMELPIYKFFDNCMSKNPRVRNAVIPATSTGPKIGMLWAELLFVFSLGILQVMLRVIDFL